MIDENGQEVDYKQSLFQELSEEGLDDEGMPTNVRLMNKDNCK